MDKNIFNAILRTDFKSFVIKVFNEVSPGSTYMDNWHIDVICDAVMNMYDGENRRLIINMPPRYMKSIICSVALPAWLLGHNPKLNIGCVSYNDELAAKFANNCRDVMQSDWYRDLFPMTRLHPSRQAINDFETTHGGGRMSTSIGGTFTGRGVDWLIIDDPQKASDANSEVARTKLNDWFGTTAYSRLNDKATGKILLVMQRLPQDDLTGHLLDTNSGFNVIKLPVIATEDETWIIKNRIFSITQTIIREQGELLHPVRENTKIVAEIKESMGEYAFVAQYQQDPCPPEGGIVKESWLKYYEDAAINSRLQPKHVFISWDTANKTGDNNAYSVGCVILMTNNYKFYLIDIIRGKWDTPQLFDKIIEVYNEYKYDQQAGNYVKLLIEDKASGEFLIPMLGKARDRIGRRIEVVPIKPTIDKISRAKALGVMIEKGNLLFPQKDEAWWQNCKKELLGFPNTKYKDQVDAMSQCINYAMQQ